MSERKKNGRPALKESERENLSCVINVRVTNDDFEKIKFIQKSLGWTKSEMLRRLVREKFDKITAKKEVR